MFSVLQHLILVLLSKTQFNKAQIFMYHDLIAALCFGIVVLFCVICQTLAVNYSFHPLLLKKVMINNLQMHRGIQFIYVA